MTVRLSSKRIQTLLGHFYAVLFAIIVFKKYRPTYLSRVSRGGQLKTPVKLVDKSVSKRHLLGNSKHIRAPPFVGLSVILGA